MSPFDWPGSPNFFCIGATRTASTSLYQYLSQHPDVLMSKQKEPHFFNLGGLSDSELPREPPPARADTAEDYRKEFAHWSGERAIGEVTPSYLYYPQTAERIYRAVPHAKIICCLRSPVERAYSHYALNRRLDVEPLSFVEALDRESERRDWGGRYAYVSKGLYNKQLAPYFDIFDSSKILVLQFEDFTRNTASTLRRIFRFLGVDENFQPDTSITHNRSGVLKGVFLRRLYRWHRPRDWLLQNLPPQLVSPLGRVLMRDLPSIEPHIRERLDQVFREDVVELEARLGIDLSHWRT